MITEKTTESYVRTLLETATQRCASDIHLEPLGDTLQIRYRIDGILQVQPEIPKHLKDSIIAHIKVLASLDVSQKRLPQDGRIVLNMSGHCIDIRVSILPTSHGESITLRILDSRRFDFRMDTLGMPEQMQAELLSIAAKNQGLMVITGPTGSGKTTTLYSLLKALSLQNKKILTAEDPVEYTLEGIVQVSMQAHLGLDFAHCLRSFLRHDPDVLMVGEIRDSETAYIATHAALTGHRVLTSLHTQDTLSVIQRLQNLNINNYLITATLEAVLAQRLVRKLCSHCKKAYTPTVSECELIGPMTAPLYMHTGCSHCLDTGYDGRIAIFELLNITDTLRTAIHNQASTHTLHQIACSEGLTQLHTSILNVIKDGYTTLIEASHHIEL